MSKLSESRNRWRYVFWVAMTILILVMLVLWKVTPKFEETVIVDEDQDAVRVLFIGNSLTFMEHVPAQFADIAKSQDKKIKLDVKQVAYPDYTLKDHWNRKRAQQAIEAQRWDYVVLQGHSKEPVLAPKEFRQYVKLFDEEAKAAHARAVLYATWADSDRLEMQDKIVEVFSKLAQDADLILAPVGEAIHFCLKENPDIELLQPDKHHATKYGAYLIAATIYSTIFKKELKDIPEAEMPVSGIVIEDNIRKKLIETSNYICREKNIFSK